MKRAPFRLVMAMLLLAVAAPVIARANAVDDAIGCDPIDPTLCLLPFPNDHFTVADPTTVTGRRIDISPLATPRALGGVKPVFTDELNRNDGFSPGSLIETFVPGLDLHQTWGTEDLPAAKRDNIADPSRYGAPDAPILIIDATTGERHPFWSELDTHPATGDDERMLLVRPAINFRESTRYLVALRRMKDAAGNVIPAGDAFASYLAGTGADPVRQAEITRIVGEVAAAETDRGNAFDPSDLYLAWEFTVASWQNLAGRALHIRDEAFAGLGDLDLADGQVDGASPAFHIDRIEQNPKGDTAAYVHGTVEVPNYLIAHEETPELYDPTGQVTTEIVSPVNTPHARFYYPPGSDLPEVNPLQPVYQAHFTCRLPISATASNPARPTLMGHGLLGQRLEVEWSSGDLMTREHNTMYCGTEWLGMSFGDIPQAVSILLDPSLFASMPDRAQQGYLNFMFLGRAMIHPDGFASDPAFQDGNGDPLIDTSELVYDGNSQGGIMGGALTALAPDFTKATLGVVGMNYSTLLNRSVDWEGEYGEIFYASFPDKREEQLMFALMQMLWDRAEGDGYAWHMTSDPYPNTPAHQVLMHVAYGDFQVANVSAEVEARTIGARLLQTSLAPSRHWSVDPTFGLDTFDVDGGGALLPWSGSALVYWDSGNLNPPNGNQAPAPDGGDPHGDPRSTALSGVQRDHFFSTGEIIDVNPGAAYCTHKFPRAIAGPCPAL